MPRVKPLNKKNKHINKFFIMLERNSVQGHLIDVFLKISVFQANFCWLGDLDKIIFPWKLENCGCLRC